MREIVLRRGERRPVVREVKEPRASGGEVLVRTLLTGVDGTDEELLSGEHGEFPEGEDHLVLGHEALAEVVEAPPGVALAQGARVVPLVRRGCGRCNRCLYGASDMCSTMDYQEHGIKELHGFMRDLWTHDARGLVAVPDGLDEVAVLAEPLSITVKALEEATRFQKRLPWFEEEGGWAGKRALVAGTGSVGMLAAFLLRDEGMEVLGVNRGGTDAFPARLLRRIGARHADAREQSMAELGEFDLVIEATGAPQVVFDALQTLDENGIMCLTGVPPQKPPLNVDVDDMMRNMVLGNRILFGSVNSRRAHFEASLARLQAFQRRWGDAIDTALTHTFAPEDAAAAFEENGEHLVKKAIDWRDGAALRRPGQN